MAQRPDALMQAGASSRPAMLSLLFVSLFACSLATGSSQHQQQPPAAWRHSPHQRQPDLEPYLEPLYERPSVYAAPQRDAGDSDDDEQFLRQLKVAAEYLDEKLAAREREQQQRALLARLGRLVDSPSSSVVADQGPAYSLGSGDDQEAGVAVVAPSVDSAPEFSDSSAPSLPFDSPNYQLLEESDSARASEQQTYDHYKQLLQTLLGSDRAQPTQGEQATPVKRESDIANIDHHERPRAKLTTLVEEEEERDDAPTSTNATNSTAAYGKVVYQLQQNGSASAGPSASSSGGVFGRMYAQLSHYLPFMNQLSILRNPAPQTRGDEHRDETKQILTGTTSAGGPAADGRGDDAHNQDEHHHANRQLAVKVSRPAKKDGDESREDDDGELLHAKPSVSVTLAHSGASKGELEDKNDQDNQNREQKHRKELDDERLKVKVSLVKEDEDEDKSGDQQQQVSAKSGNAKRLMSPTSVQAGPDDSSELGELDVGQMMPVIIKHPHYNHLVRPAQDAEPDQAVGGGSLLGKYIYAPTQHYYLNSVAPTTSGHAAVDQQQHHHQLQAAAAAAAAARHFRPGDQVYGSYGLAPDTPMKAAYAFQKDPGMIVNGAGPLAANQNSLANKTNDLYFLVMVGAFCVMAMAVVLAAGAFAYRVQQSRKSSQDTDYPTYGVVGPNNMAGAGKCGASAFTMGGYFMGPPTGGAGGASKSGSSKHLADLYGHPGGGPVASAGARDANGGSDSGLNSLGRSSHSGHTTKKAASSSASSLNNGAPDCQPGGRRHAPPAGSFISAASQDAARMYHYQHQKQQMIISDRNSAAGGRHTSASDLDSDDENEDGSYTVYECPGLASAHEMEIKNPLFNDDQTP